MGHTNVYLKEFDRNRNTVNGFHNHSRRYCLPSVKLWHQFEWMVWTIRLVIPNTLTSAWAFSHTPSCHGGQLGVFDGLAVRFPCWDIEPTYIWHPITGFIDLLFVCSEAWGHAFPKGGWMSQWEFRCLQWFSSYDICPECKGLGFDSSLRNRIFQSVEIRCYIPNQVTRIFRSMLSLKMTSVTTLDVNGCWFIVHICTT